MSSLIYASWDRNMDEEKIFILKLPLRRWSIISRTRLWFRCLRDSFGWWPNVMCFVLLLWEYFYSLTKVRKAVKKTEYSPRLSASLVSKTLGHLWFVLRVSWEKGLASMRTNLRLFHRPCRGSNRLQNGESEIDASRRGEVELLGCKGIECQCLL